MQKTLLLIFFGFVFLFLLFNSCQHVRVLDESAFETQGLDMLEAGELNQVHAWADSIKRVQTEFDRKWMFADSIAEIATRMAIDFSVTEFAVKQGLKRCVGDFSNQAFKAWHDTNALEWRMINGEKMYFKRAAFNLMLSLGKEEGLISSDLSGLCLDHTSKVLKLGTDAMKSISCPREFQVKFSISVKPDAVPDGEVIRCWLPYPKGNHLRQQHVEFISASQDRYVISGDTCVHRTIYMEKAAEQGVQTLFEVKYKFKSFAQYDKIEPLQVLPYDTTQQIYSTFTAEELPHLVFSDTIKALTNAIVGEEKNPFLIVKRLYYWIHTNIPWSGALEYSLMPNITKYVVNNRRGDCGMQTMLFMTMARYKGIPVKWQSGWMMHPGHVNLHDWCEVYYEGVGWVPLDMSFGLQKSPCVQQREFYMTGIDQHRFIINDGIAGEFYPQKRFLRSEPYDFQRGEVEWRGGNLYFNQWDYELKISN